MGSSLPYRTILNNPVKNHKKTKIMADWKQGKFGCFGNMKLCLITYLAPCVTVGAIAEKLDEDTLVCGALKMIIPLYNCMYFRSLRVKAAEKSGIAEESCISFFM